MAVLVHDRLGLTMSGIGLTGWATDELVSARETWLAWPAVFALFGNVAPLFALHRSTPPGTTRAGRGHDRRLTSPA